MKLLSFVAGVIAALLSVLLWSLWAEGGDRPVRLPATALEAEGVTAEGPLGARGGLPVPASARAKVESRRVPVEPTEEVETAEEIERSVVERIMAGLGPNWVTPIKAPAVGEGPTVGGVPHGEWLLFHPVHTWTDRGRFVLGSREGEWKLYDMDDRLIRVRTFVRGKIEGTMKDRADSESWRTYHYIAGELQIP